MSRIALYILGLCLLLSCLSETAFSATVALNVRDFGATGDGVTNDGPAFQAALDALAAAGGGTLFVPEGKYAITTPVVKNFAGLASSITITGVESQTEVSPPSSSGEQLSQGLDLLSEIYPRTGEPENAFSISGLQSLVVKELAFVGTPTANTDAAVTLFLSDIDNAQIKHSEFYGLSSLVNDGAIVFALRSDLEITRSKFLGSTATSGGYLPVVQNLEWRGITVSDSVFLDYGQRPELFGKMGLAAPISWINIGNAAPVTNHSPRREVVIRNVFLDEGGYFGLSSLPYRYTPASAPIDLIYVTGLEMNVSNFGQYGHLLYDAQRVLIEHSRYGYSQNAAAAVALANVDTAILDRLTCEADADHLTADARTGELTVINSTYTQLDSLAPVTKAFNTATPDDDPVQYVRNRFAAVLDRDPDAAAHFYWSDLLLRCDNDSACVDSGKAALNDYLSQHPAPKFTISGRVTDKDNVPLSDVAVTLSGSQSVTAVTDANGSYDFANLPTSGRYVVTPAKAAYVFESPSETLVTPSSDRTINFTGERLHVLKGTITAGGTPVAGVVVALSGSATASAITDNTGAYSFELKTGNYVLTPARPHYTFSPATQSVNDLSADTQVDFSATVDKHSISGRVLDTKGQPLGGVTMILLCPPNVITTTAADGSYAFANIDGGSNCTVTATKDGYLLTPSTQTFGDLSADTKADFQAALLPVLLTAADSDRAVALELTTFIADPFPITNTFLSGGRNRTRVVFFAKDLELLPGEGVEVITAQAEDSAHVLYPLRVEFVSPLPDLPHVNQIVIRLNNDLEDAGDVYVTITVHGLTSNKARIAIGHLTDEP